MRPGKARVAMDSPNSEHAQSIYRYVYGRHIGRVDQFPSRVYSDR